MATRTIVKETRSLDHIYDPVHITSGAADHYKLTSQALSTQLEKVPDSHNYFSELRNYPNAGYRAGRGKDNFLPKYIDPQWETTQDVKLENHMESDIIYGKERFKYEQRPTGGAGRPGGSTMFTSSAPQIVMYQGKNTTNIGGNIGMGGSGQGGGSGSDKADSGSANNSNSNTQQLIPSSMTHNANLLPAPSAFPDGVLSFNVSYSQDGYKRTIGTQSLYRESESQTLPYTPDFLARNNPEILSLKNLSSESGTLPASLFEVQIIQRTRQKRLFEYYLPPATDEFSFTARAALLESQEFKEWRERESQIITLQERRLEMVKAMIKERDAKRALKAEQKTERLRDRLTEQRDKALTNIGHKRVKILRKMYTSRTRALRQVHSLGHGRGAGGSGKGAKSANIGKIIESYVDGGSQVYAPLTRMGHKPLCNTSKIEIQPADLKTYQKLVALERSLPARVLATPDSNSIMQGINNSMMNDKNNSMNNLSSNMGGQQQGPPTLNANALGALESLQSPGAANEISVMNQFQNAQNQNPQSQQTPMAGAGAQFDAGAVGGADLGPQSPSRGGKTQYQNQQMNLNKSEGGPGMGMSTMNQTQQATSEALPEEEERGQALLLLQRVIRGRALQNRMFIGKEKRLDLIDELRSAELLMKNPRPEDEEVVKQLQNDILNDHNEQVVLGALVSKELNDLSALLEKKQEEQRLAVLTKLANEERKERELAEARRTSTLSHIQNVETEVFHQLLQDKQATVDSFLEEILGRTVNTTARKRAYEEARAQAARINQVVDGLEAAERAAESERQLRIEEEERKMRGELSSDGNAGAAGSGVTGDNPDEAGASPDSTENTNTEPKSVYKHPPGSAAAASTAALAPIPVSDDRYKHSRDCVKELVGQLVFPQSQRHLIKRQVEAESKRFIEAARLTLDATMEKVHVDMAQLRKDKEDQAQRNASGGDTNASVKFVNQ